MEKATEEGGHVREDGLVGLDSLQAICFGLKHPGWTVAWLTTINDTTAETN